MDKYKYENNLVLFFAGHFFTGQWRRHGLALVLCCTMAEKERKGGCITGVAWMAEAAQVSSAAVVDVMEPDDPLTLAMTTQGGRWELGQGENSAATLLQGGEGRAGAANGRGSPRAASSDAGAGAVVQGSSGSGHAWHALRFEWRH
jgi:hypothetical protein